MIYDIILDGKNQEGEPGFYLISSKTNAQEAADALDLMQAGAQPGETYFIAPWREATNPKRARIYGPFRRALDAQEIEAENLQPEELQAAGAAHAALASGDFYARQEASGYKIKYIGVD